MKKFRRLIRRCFLSLVLGFFWLFLLFIDAGDDVGSEYRAQAVDFITLGICLPFIIPGFFIKSSLSLGNLFFIGVVVYLIIGLIASFFMRASLGTDFFFLSIKDD